MEVSLLNPGNSINRALLKVGQDRSLIDTFKRNISGLLDHIKESESEEFHKNIMQDY